MPRRLTWSALIPILLTATGCFDFGGFSWGGGGWFGVPGGGYTEPEPLPPPGTMEVDLTSRYGLPFPLQVWYPTAIERGRAHRYDGEIPGHALDGVAPDCTEPRMVVVFSHGSGTTRYQSFTTTEYLARVNTDAIVLAPDHVLDTLEDPDEAHWAELILRRPADLVDAYDWLVAESLDPSSPFHGCVEPADGFAVLGHGEGAFAALAVAGAPVDVRMLADECAADPVAECGRLGRWLAAHPEDDLADLSDPRVWAVAAWAPLGYELFGGRLGDVDVPAVVIGADRDAIAPWDSQVNPAFREMEAVPRYLLRLADAGHYSFTDVCSWDGWAWEDGCSTDFRPPEDTLLTVKSLTYLFFKDVALHGHACSFGLFSSDDVSLRVEVD